MAEGPSPIELHDALLVLLTLAVELAETGRLLQLAGDELAGHVGFVAAAQPLQAAGETLVQAGARMRP